MALALVCVGCDREGAASVAPTTEGDAFPIARPETRDIVISHEYVADIRAARHAEIRSRYFGIIEAVAVDEGQAVKHKQRLFTINARSRKQELAVSRAASVAVSAELEAAQQEVANVQLLADKNVVSPAELARAKSKVQMLEARLEQAKAATGRTAVEVDRAEIRAPFDGVVNRIPFKAGSAVDETVELTTISDTREVLAYFAVAEREYLEHVRATGSAAPRTVRLRLADGSLFEETGTIDAVTSEIDAATGTIMYRARFANPSGLVKHGSSAKVVLETTLKAALVVPQKATFEVQGNVYLYTVDASGIAHARKLEIRERVDDIYVLEAGLAADERFVVEGVQKIKDGARIDVRPSMPSATPAEPAQG